MFTLGSDQVDLWFSIPDQIDDPHLLNEYKILLSENELRQMDRFIYSKDKHRFLITRALLRTTLSSYATILPENWSFSLNSYGKPHIDHNIFPHSISFNISHTDDLILLGVTREHNLGVDVENICVRPAPLDIAESYFADLEIAALRNLCGKEQSKLFFRYWTLKESYFKARGIGLSAPLGLIHFIFENDSKLRVAMDPTLNDSPDYWKFWQFQPMPEQIASVCVTRSPLLVQKVNLKKVTPLEKADKINICSVIEN